MILQQIVVGPFETNCYLAGDENQGFVIDPGDDAHKIMQELNRLGMQVKGILLTHGHFDHFAAVDQVAYETGAPVMMGQADHGFYTKLPSFFSSFTPPKTSISRFLEPGQELTAGQLTLQALATPGHSPGGFSFYTNGVLFSGDSLFYRSVGRCDLPGGDWEVLKHSIQQTLFSLPDETRVYCGHGSDTTIGEEKEKNPYL